MTIPSAASPYSSDVQFYGVQRPTINPNTLQITQQEFCHDVCVLTFWADDIGADSYNSGMPMSLTWGRPLVKRAFYGYVSHASRSNNALAGSMDLMTRNSTTVVCFGASWPMKASGTITWQNQTASQVVTQIAQSFGLITNIIPHDTVWPVLHMAGMTFWEFCVMLAKRIGYTFYVSGATLFFKPRNTDPTQLAGLVAYYDYRRDPGSMPVFMPTVGATNPFGGDLTNRNVSGIDFRTNQIIYSSLAGSPQSKTFGNFTDTPVFNKTEHFTVRNQDEANVKINGAGQSNQLYITASARGTGDPLIAQGSLVFVANANGSQNGLWFVTKCVQNMAPTAYSMDFSLGRDSLGATVQVSGVTSVNTQHPVILSGGQWVAA